MHVAGTWQPTSAAQTVPMPKGEGRVFAQWPVWGLYLFLAVSLAPVLQPVGPAQLAIIDGINFLAMGLFLSLVVVARQRVEMPLIVPVLIISAGSLLALTNALSVKAAVLTMAQDAYLYLWFVFLVNIMRPRGALRGMRVAWVWTGVVMSILGLLMLLSSSGQSFGSIFAAKGQRAVGLFYGPNTYADYLVMSLFVAISLMGQVRKIWLWPAMGVMMIGLIATKSNGAMGSLVAGVAVWAVLRLFSRSRSRITVIVGTLLIAGVAAIGWRAASESRLLAPPNSEAAEQSFLGRVERSSKSRAQIWERLGQNFEKTPLGIGAGNSSHQRLGVASRERKDSYLSKEAHNDYLAYIIERGPLGIAGLVLMMAASFFAIWKGWKSGRTPLWQAGVGGAIAAAMVGGLVASSIHSLVMEKLHFRHFWLFMALLWAFRSPATETSAAVARGNGQGTTTGVLRRRLRLGRSGELSHN